MFEIGVVFELPIRKKAELDVYKNDDMDKLPVDGRYIRGKITGRV
jgi:hypothetical protein